MTNLKKEKKIVFETLTLIIIAMAEFFLTMNILDMSDKHTAYEARAFALETVFF